jgi:cytochrome P450
MQKTDRGHQQYRFDSWLRGRYEGGTPTFPDPKMHSPHSTENEPRHARAAPAHPDPYPYYARLAREQPAFRDEANGWWVVASTAAVEEVLTSELCLTRPLGEPVPAAFVGKPIEQIFGRLVRLRDDEARKGLKAAVTNALRGLDFARVAETACRRAAALDAEIGTPLDPAWVNRFMFSLPVQVLAELLGIAASEYAKVTSWLGEYGTAVAAVATGIPAPNTEMIERGNRAAKALIGLVSGLKASSAHGPLLDALMREGQRFDCADEDITANAVGYLLQGFGATASLIGSTLLALARNSSLRTAVEAERTLIRDLVQEVLRCDTITSSTFRFMAADGVIAGQHMRKGELIIVLIAAANRDPALNPSPDRFDIARKDRKYLEFGRGPHSCPADKFAPLLAEIAVDHLLTRGVPLERLEGSLSYALSGHIRTPLFSS